MVGRLIKVALVATAVAAVVQVLPDIKRYVAMRQM
jgi:hypothetical protein